MSPLMSDSEKPDIPDEVLMARFCARLDEEAFRELTGVPIVLNTSFNENEPVVCRPEEALDCFLRTKMDLLVMGNWMVRRGERPALSHPRGL